jgi:WD40 repeat protein
VSTVTLDGDRIIFSPDGTLVASASGNFVKIWKSDSGYSCSKAIGHHSQAVTRVSFAPDGQLMASQSQADVKIWDTTSGECLFTFDSLHGFHSIVFSPNSAFVACSHDGWHNGLEWTIWNVRTRRQVKRMGLSYTHLVALSPNGTQMASVSYQRIELWSLTTGNRLAQMDFDEPSRKISKIGFDGSGTSIIVTADDGHAKTWDVDRSSSSNRDSSHKKSASSPIVLIPIQKQWTYRGGSAPSQCYRYEGADEWIVDESGMRILWVPPEGRGDSIDVCGRKVAVGTESGRAYIVDISGTS